MAFIGDNYRRGNGNPRYSPTFPRGGLGAQFACEVFDNDPGVTMTIAIQHKNIEDDVYDARLHQHNGGRCQLGKPKFLTGIKEEVRLAFTVNGANPEDTVYANILAPAWRPY